MNKFFTLFAVVGMFLFVSCGDSSQSQAQGEEDADNAANELIEEAEAEAEEVMSEGTEMVDSMTMENDSTEMEAPMEGGEDMEAEGEEVETAE